MCKWPGSVHDSFIFNECKLHDVLREGNMGWLVGDSGYPLKKFLMTPKLNPQTEAEERYNRAHAQTRVVVERAFDVLKYRFSCVSVCVAFNPLSCIVLYIVEGGGIRKCGCLSIKLCDLLSSNFFQVFAQDWRMLTIQP